MAEPISFRWRAPGRVAIGRAARRWGPMWVRGALSGQRLCRWRAVWSEARGCSALPHCLLGTCSDARALVNDERDVHGGYLVVRLLKEAC